MCPDKNQEFEKKENKYGLGKQLISDKLLEDLTQEAVNKAQLECNDGVH